MDSHPTPKPQQANDPLHGIKLATILEDLVEHYGWERLATKVNINCFKSDPSIKSSLTFLRKTPWARTEVERLYVWLLQKRSRQAAQRAKANHIQALGDEKDIEA